jgi:hypothetical protein
MEAVVEPQAGGIPRDDGPPRRPMNSTSLVCVRLERFRTAPPRLCRSLEERTDPGHVPVLASNTLQRPRTGNTRHHGVDFGWRAASASSLAARGSVARSRRDPFRRHCSPLQRVHGVRRLLPRGCLVPGGVGVLVAKTDDRRLLLVGVVANAVVVLVWNWSRTAGLPIGPNPGVAEEVGAPDGVSTTLEAVIIVWTTLLLTQVYRWREPSRRFAVGSAVFVWTVVVGLTAWRSSPRRRARRPGTRAACAVPARARLVRRT